jgi:hypothetical protein
MLVAVVEVLETLLLSLLGDQVAAAEVSQQVFPLLLERQTEAAVGVEQDMATITAAVTAALEL